MAETASSQTRKSRKGNQKRTAIACDECRLRKARCSGIQPCEACQATDRYCTFNLSASRSTGSGTRIRILEDRLRRARAYLSEAQRRYPSMAEIDFDALLGPIGELNRAEAKPDNQSTDRDDNNPDSPGELETMMNSYGQMNLGGNHRDFYGAASGLAWIQKTRDYFEDVSNSDVENAAAVQLFDAPLPPAQALTPEPPQLLPPRPTATRLLYVVFSQVYPLFCFLSADEFHESTDRLYKHHPSDYEETDQSFLPLFYLVMALGYLFSRHEHSKLGCRASVDEAMKYFITARKMVDIAHLRTIVSLQAVISIILYLISTARMASAHAFLGAACAAAMRQGLHFRSTHEPEFPEKERKVRRRVFWAVMNLDGYITSILGLPPFLDATAVDPAIDLTIQSALIEGRATGSVPNPNGIALKASAKHIELMRVVFKAQRTLFPKPVDPPDTKSGNGKISVSLKLLESVESQFREWAESLTEILTHPDDDIETQSVKYEMHSCYYFAQIVLYRPFLHYLATPNREQSASQRQYTYATACVTMAKKVVEISVEHQRKGLLCPASWPSVYTVFIAVVCLVFAHATRKEGTDDEQTRKDIQDGIRLLASTACTTDTGSVRCLEILRRLLQRVSYAVNVELDDIYSATKPCCTIDFTSRAQGDNTVNLTELHIANTSTSKADRETSEPSSMPSISSNGRRISLSPDETLTKPSFSEIAPAHRNSEPQISQSEDEQMIDVPYGGTIDWHGMANAHVRLGVEPPPNHQRPQQQRSLSTPGNTIPLTAADIADFLHTSPFDEHFGRRSQ